MTTASLPRRLAAEALGTAMLLAAVVGSAAMAGRLAGGNAALELLANALATSAMLAVIIVILAPVSGAHLNPVVTAALAVVRRARWRDVLPYAAAQLAGAIAGVAIANAMFGLPLLTPSTTVREGMVLAFSEGVATFGLVVVILGCLATGRRSALPAAVALYIGAAYWFTGSTAFANPAATIARSLTETFAGIAPAAIPGFILAQCLGAALAVAVSALVFGRRTRAVAAALS